MKLTKQPVLALMACVLAGCAGVDPIEMSGDPAKVPPFKTYRIYEEQLAFATELSEAERSEVAADLRGAVTRAFTGRGYSEDGANADMLVSLGAASRATFDSSANPNDSRIRNVDPSVLEANNPHPPPGSEPGPSGVGREGDLFLYLVDPKTKRVIWRASTNGAATTPSEAKRRGKAAYEAMVEKLPKAGARP